MIYITKFNFIDNHLICPLCSKTQKASHSPIANIVSWKCEGCEVRICLPENEKVVRRLHPEDDDDFVPRKP